MGNLLTRLRDGRGQSSVVRAVGLFALVGLLAAGLLAFGSILASRRAATDAAIRDSRHDAEVVARTAVEPALTDGVLTRDANSIAQLDRVVRSRVLDENLVRVKVWAADGRILYSNEPRLIGSTYTLGADEQAALRSGRAVADVSDLSRPENRFDRAFHKLLEVYLPVRTPTGKSVLFEAYFRYDTVTAGANRILAQFAPIMLGSLLALELLQIPFAWSMARRIQTGQRRQEQLLRRAIAASDVERRRIASDLHDGVVQDLAGVSYALASVRNPDPASAEVLADAAAGTRRSIRELRTLLVDIYPPSLRDAGLHAALSDLTAPLAAHGIETSIDLPTDLQFPPDVEELLFRATQEALRNVVAHAGARRVHISLARPDHRAVLEVRDDGVGFDPATVGDRDSNGHLGLRVMADLAHDAGGQFEIHSQSGTGTCVHLEVPTR
jgi:signal transduction histidine kinase